MDATARTAAAMAGILLLATSAPAGADPDALGGRRRGPSAPSLHLVQEQSLKFSIQDVSGPGGQSLPLRIALPSGEFGEFSYLMFRGLPEGVRMSTGFPVKESWAISLKDASKLALVAPDGFSGSFQVEASLFTGRDAPPEKRTITVDIRPTATAGQSAPSEEGVSRDLTSAPVEGREEIASLPATGSVGSQHSTSVKVKPAAQSVPSEEETALLGRADEAVKSGDISAARLLYEHLAQRGSAKGAFSMAQTFDPEFLKTLFVKGLKPDVQKAREWYSKAKELGHAAAGRRLTGLSAAN
jgi:hypothetical protein